jgi:histidine triad (HIT) family protein
VEECIFCKIVEGKIPCHKIYEDKQALVFLDINPITEGHSLVVSKKHYNHFLEADDKELVGLMKVTKKVSEALKKALNAQGINIGINVGRAAGQLVDHLHVHVIPRHGNDGLKSWEGKPIESPEETLKKIKAVLG